MSRAVRLATDPVVRAAAYAACLVASVALFFQDQIGTGFDRLFGDRFDAVIEISILEHWFNVWRGYAGWSQTFYFFPYKATLAYNDGYLLYGIPYALFRALGADPFLSSGLVDVVLRVTAFVAFQLFLRQTLRVRWGFSVLGAVLFTLSCNMAVQANHEQLLSVCFAPLFAWMAAAAAAAAAQGRARRFAAWGCGAAALMSAWLLTAFYMAWFTLFFAACYAGLAVAADPAGAWRRLRGLPRRIAPAGALAALAFAVGTAPFLMLYLPKARATGMHPFAEALGYAIQPLDLIHVGDGNVLFGWLDRALNAWFRPDMPRYSEHTTGLTPVLVAVFLVASASLWAPPRRPGAAPLRLLSLTAILTWLLALRLGRHTLWREVYAFVPGARAVRVVARYQLFLAAPVIAVVTARLDRAGRTVPAALVAALAALLVTEQVTLDQPVSLDRRAELAELDSIPAPPPACRSFFVSHARAEAFGSSEINSLYSHNVEAMLLAEHLRLPTIYGFSTFAPPDWNFADPERPDYPARVAAYVAAHRLADVCALDLRERSWSLFEPPAPP